MVKIRTTQQIILDTIIDYCKKIKECESKIQYYTDKAKRLLANDNEYIAIIIHYSLIAVKYAQEVEQLKNLLKKVYGV